MTRVTPSAALLSFSDVPAEWLAEIRPQLHSEENVQAVLEVDLDTRLQFGRGLLVATERRLLARAPGQPAWLSWEYHRGLQLSQHDHAGVGHLELLDGQGRLAHWCYTLGQNLQAVRLLVAVVAGAAAYGFLLDAVQKYQLGSYVLEMNVRIPNWPGYFMLPIGFGLWSALNLYKIAVFLTGAEDQLGTPRDAAL